MKNNIGCEYCTPKKGNQVKPIITNHTFMNCDSIEKHVVDKIIIEKDLNSSDALNHNYYLLSTHRRTYHTDNKTNTLVSPPFDTIEANTRITICPKCGKDFKKEPSHIDKI